MFKAYYEKLLVQLAVDFNSTPQAENVRTRK